MEIYNIEVTRRPLWPRAFGILTYLELHSDHFSSNLNLIGRYCEGLPQQLCLPHCEKDEAILIVRSSLF